MSCGFGGLLRGISRLVGGTVVDIITGDLPTDVCRRYVRFHECSLSSLFLLAISLLLAVAILTDMDISVAPSFHRVGTIEQSAASGLKESGACVDLGRDQPVQQLKLVS